MTQIYRYGLQRPPGRQDGHRGAAAIMEQPTLGPDGPTDRPTCGSMSDTGPVAW
jgi:hypothetical protein